VDQLWPVPGVRHQSGYPQHRTVKVGCVARHTYVCCETMKSQVAFFWVVMYCLHLHPGDGASKVLRNVGTLPHNYTASPHTIWRLVLLFHVTHFVSCRNQCTSQFITWNELESKQDLHPTMLINALSLRTDLRIQIFGSRTFLSQTPSDYVGPHLRITAFWRHFKYDAQTRPFTRSIRTFTTLLQSV
jgi:hypothetical protein